MEISQVSLAPAASGPGYLNRRVSIPLVSALSPGQVPGTGVPQVLGAARLGEGRSGWKQQNVADVLSPACLQHGEDAGCWEGAAAPRSIAAGGKPGRDEIRGGG